MTEEVREALMRLSMCAKGDCAICKYANDIGCSVEEQITMVNNNARIIADALDRLEEEKHGRWMPTEDPYFMECSECGAVWDAVHYKHCPTCDARMDGDDNEID